MGWGVLSALSLLLGSYIGIVCLPSQRVRSFFMAFGGGALLEALSIELFGEILNRIDEGHDVGLGSGLAFVAAAGAITGGLLSEFLNRIIAGKGGFLRKYATAKSYISSMKRRYNLRVARQLKFIPMFSDLDNDSLADIANNMERKIFLPSQTIFSEVTVSCPIYLIHHGQVQLELLTKYEEDNTTNEFEKDVLEAKDVFVISKGQIFGEMSLLTGADVDCSAIALTKCTVWVIPNNVLVELLQHNKKMRTFVEHRTRIYLQEAPIFRNISQSSLSRLLVHMKQEHYHEGDILFHDVDSSSPIHFVVLGSVQVSTSRTNQEVIIGTNDVCGADHLITGRAVPQTAQALTDCTIMSVSRKDFDMCLDADPKLLYAIKDNAQRILQSGNNNANIKKISISREVSPENSNIDVVDSRYCRVGHPTISQLGWHRTVHAERTTSDKLEDTINSNNVVGRDASSIVIDLESEGVSLEDGNVSSDLDYDYLPDRSSISLLKQAEQVFHLEHPTANKQVAEDRAKHAAIMIWCGILIDGIPESIVIGVLVVSGKTSSMLAFIIGVFLSNFPEVSEQIYINKFRIQIYINKFRIY